jgi:hypothetical protein
MFRVSPKALLSDPRAFAELVVTGDVICGLLGLVLLWLVLIWTS